MDLPGGNHLWASCSLLTTSELCAMVSFIAKHQEGIWCIRGKEAQHSMFYISSPRPVTNCLKLLPSLHTLPHKILQHAQVFHDHIQYLVSRSLHATGSVNDGSVPEELKKLRAEKLSERMKEEILQDNDARHVSWFSLHLVLVDILDICWRIL